MEEYKWKENKQKQQRKIKRKKIRMKMRKRSGKRKINKKGERDVISKRKTSFLQTRDKPKITSLSLPFQKK